MIKLPGLIDVHVHLRDPGQTHKEDFTSGTSAALAGGFTTVLDMPNNATPITTADRLTEKIQIAQSKTVCDIGFYFGSLGDNIDEFAKIYDKVKGIKLYLNPTTGNYLVNNEIVDAVYQNWKSEKPIMVHAEADVIGSVVEAVKKYGKHTHVCHTSSKEELSYIIRAKEGGLPITCGVCPHHLFLSEEDEKMLGGFGKMKPSLKSKKDQQFLWDNLEYVDVIESDHAPHTKEEKKAVPPAFGVPGLETTLPLLLTAVAEGRLTLEKIIELCHINPSKLFNIVVDKNTYVEVDEHEAYVIRNEDLHTKCGWSPFGGYNVKGRVRQVYLRSTKVFEDGHILAIPGTGRVI